MSSSAPKLTFINHWDEEDNQEPQATKSAFNHEKYEKIGFAKGAAVVQQEAYQKGFDEGWKQVMQEERLKIIKDAPTVLR